MGDAIDNAIWERLSALPADERAAMLARVRAARDRRLRRAQRPYKACPGCSLELPARSFAEDNERSDGLRRICRDCDHKRVQNSRLSPTHGPLSK